MSGKLITVIGATGEQGCSVVKSLLNAGYKVRGVSRDDDTDEAKKLKDQNVEVIKADMADRNTDLGPVFKDAYGAYLMTDFWDKKSQYKEEEHGKRLVNAARDAGVTHIIWSTLPNVEKHAHQKYSLPQFSDKAAVTEYIQSLQKGSNPAFKYATFFYPAFYYQNLKNYFPPKYENGEWIYKLPETKQITAYDVRDTGEFVSSIFGDPEKYNGKHVRSAGFEGSLKELVERIGKAAKVNVKLEETSRDKFSSSYQGAKELVDMFGWCDECGYYGPDKDLSAGKEANRNQSSPEKFVNEGGIEFNSDLQKKQATP